MEVAILGATPSTHRTHRPDGYATARMIEVVLNDRLGKKIRVKCKCVSTHPTPSCPPAPPFSPRWAPCGNPKRSERPNLTVPNSPPSPPTLTNSEDDTIGDLKKLVAAQIGTRPEKIRIQKWYNVYKDHITLEDYEIHDGMGLEMYYN